MQQDFCPLARVLQNQTLNEAVKSRGKEEIMIATSINNYYNGAVRIHLEGFPGVLDFPDGSVHDSYTGLTWNCSLYGVNPEDVQAVQQCREALLDKFLSPNPKAPNDEYRECAEGILGELMEPGPSFDTWDDVKEKFPQKFVA
jgi:hypothetical protein